MNFSQARDYIRSCIHNWNLLKNMFEGRKKQILENAYLVIDYHCSSGCGQFSIRDFSAGMIAENHPALVIDSEAGRKLVRLARQRKILKSRMEEIEKNLKWIERKMCALENETELNDFSVEIRFRQLDFGLVEQIKKTPFIDRNKTYMLKGAIKIALKGNEGK